MTDIQEGSQTVHICFLVDFLRIFAFYTCYMSTKKLPLSLFNYCGLSCGSAFRHTLLSH